MATFTVPEEAPDGEACVVWQCASQDSQSCSNLVISGGRSDVNMTTTKLGISECVSEAIETQTTLVTVTLPSTTVTKSSFSLKTARSTSTGVQTNTEDWKDHSASTSESHSAGPPTRLSTSTGSSPRTGQASDPMQSQPSKTLSTITNPTQTPAAEVSSGQATSTPASSTQAPFTQASRTQASSAQEPIQTTSTSLPSPTTVTGSPSEANASKAVISTTSVAVATITSTVTLLHTISTTLAGLSHTTMWDNRSAPTTCDPRWDGSWSFTLLHTDDISAMVDHYRYASRYWHESYRLAQLRSDVLSCQIDQLKLKIEVMEARIHGENVKDLKKVLTQVITSNNKCTKPAFDPATPKAMSGVATPVKPIWLD
ncbi:hypothetical protein PG987_001874 [Apiospora arundinis]